MNEPLKIGPVCQSAGVTHRTVRYYEEYGFILPQKAADSAHKLYPADVVPIIKYVKFLQDIGYSLQQIKNLIGLTRSTRTRSKWLMLKLRAEVQKQQQLLAAKIQSLQNQEASLINLLQNTESCANCQAQDCAPCLTDPVKNLPRAFGVPFTVPPAGRLLKDGDTITVGELTFTVIHTPGHSPGGIALKLDQWLFTGDTLFAGSIGRTDFPGGSHPQLITSIRTKLLTFPDELIVLPGHEGTTTIGRERTSNPFLQ